jgi:hypothetical protein
MTLRRRRLWLVALAGLVLVGGVWVWAGSVALRCKDADRIKDGMTLEQVVTILGRSPDYRLAESRELKLRSEAWLASDGDIFLVFNADGTVVDRYIVELGFLSCQWWRFRSRIRL